MNFVDESNFRIITQKVITHHVERICDVHELNCEALHGWETFPNLLLDCVVVGKGFFQWLTLKKYNYLINRTFRVMKMGTVTLSADRESFSIENLISSWRKALGVFMTLAFSGLAIFLLYVALINRSELIWTAENGWGYGFGVAGGVLMLLLLLYPLSKHSRAMTRHLSVKFWFRLHMVFGVLGPVLIVMHSSYRLGSMNGSVAFFSMLIVAISGLFGRYFYTRVHYGLYGRKATFASLSADSKELNKKLGPLFELKPKAKELLRDHESRALELPTGLIDSAIHWVSTRLRSARLYRTVMRTLNAKLLAAAKLKGWSKTKVRRKQLHMKQILIAHNRLIRQMLELHFYERLFAFWHLMHLPLFIMLIITGFVHVYAVHAY